MPGPINYYLPFVPVQTVTGNPSTNINNSSWSNVLSQNNGSNIAWQLPLTSAYTEQQSLLGSTALATNPYGFSGTPYAGLIGSTTNALTNSSIPGATNGLYGGNPYGTMGQPTLGANFYGAPGTGLGNASGLGGMPGTAGSTNLYGASSTVFGSATDLYSASLGGNTNLYGGGSPGLNGSGSVLPGMGTSPGMATIPGMGTGMGTTPRPGTPGMIGAGSTPTTNLYGANSSVFGSANDIYAASLSGNPNPYGGAMGTTGNTGMGGMPGMGTGTGMGGVPGMGTGGMGTGGTGTGGMVGAGSTPTTNLYGARSTAFGSANDIYAASMAGTTNLYGGTSTTFGTANNIYTTSLGGMPGTGTGGMPGMPGMGTGGGGVTQPTLPTTPLSPAAAGLFRLAAAGEGRPDILSGIELASLLRAYAPTGAFNLDSFQRFGLDLGIDRATATRAFIGSASNGTLPVQTVFNAAVTQGDRQTSTWNPAQFGQVVGMIASSGAAPANPAQSAFNYLSGGQQTLTPQSLQSQLGVFTRGDIFDVSEFQDFGTILNLSPANSAAIYGAFQRATFGQPSVSALASFASQRADPRSGTWTPAQFAQVAQDLALLGASTPIPASMQAAPTTMIPSAGIPAGPHQLPGMNMNLPGVPGMPGMPTTMPSGHAHAHYSHYGFRNYSIH